ncbi:uncharacterized protein LOC106051505 isoform X3 [Biomphalaria glabrata]|nr:uncharacterized protein LOC106051505 isoform X3 [Biomphalaria glabrata]XP_055866028.1 uncharacterized protein LOC106051505 isoform X3 [Biomphalaria glabrata]XP_055866029.1 uncharacterized protein LOC106051505 isoform X3 [Biomphalaria glabrata]XP_055866030.1 uncharacterized protein LOC106051505 isoform X3 [Biomphalaria glabrata]XP_055866031.1 uncharacterized protein LOC106051505 isoform X3 [Biomphalaria glabrata]XP_055866032.1 uncharacterized protein LOC106051505 isoform X3 [Biomphalaria gla
MKDSRKIVHCTIDSCNFTKDFREIVECNITLDKINYQLKLKCLQRNADWTPVGLWSLLVKNNDMIFIESGRCNLYLYAKPQKVNCTYIETCEINSFVICSIEKIFPQAICKFYVSSQQKLNNEVFHNHTAINKTVTYYHTLCKIEIKKQIGFNYLRDLNVEVFPNASNSKEDETIINIKTFVVNIIKGSECQEITTLDFQDNEKLTNYSSETFSPNGFTEIFNTTDLSTSFTKTQSDNILKIIAFGIVGSCVALTLLMCLIYNLCFRVYYRLKFTFNTDKKMSNCCKHAEQVDNSDIYLLNKLNRTKLKDIPIEGKPMKMNANRETLGSLPDHYCTIDRTSYSRKATTVKQSSRDTLDFDPYSTIEECLVDMKCNKLISSQFGITENIITSSVIIISDKSKDDVPIERVSKRLLDGNIYESIA